MANPRIEVRPQVLQDYALLADGERGALVGPEGEIAWMCAPSWDDEAVFASLIGGHGFYAIRPVGQFVWGGYYETDSLIWRSRWITNDGIIECREALAFPGAQKNAVILRQVMAIEGDARIQVHLEVRTDFGITPMSHLECLDDVWHARTGSLRIRWQGAGDARPTTGRREKALEFEMVVREGESHNFVLEVSQGEFDKELANAEICWHATERAWHDAVPKLDTCVSPSASRHSFAVLLGLTSKSGGMVAAATTSLPERAEEGRNYDYRYVWIRDQCYAGHAFASIGETTLLHDAVRFVTDRLLADGSLMSPAYRASGLRVPDQRKLDLPGYPGGADCIGNWVNRQFQLDAFGESLLLLAEAARLDLLDAAMWKAAEIAVDTISSRWTEPDAGIWELENQNWTHSRLIAAAGLRAIASVASPLDAGDCLALSDRIVADTAAHATHRDGYWQRTPSDEGVDGSLLLVSLRGAVPSNDPRTLATLAAYQRDLVVDGYAYRFRHDNRELELAEGSFVLCGFLMAMALQEQGDDVEARAWWERTRASCGPPGLYSEEFDSIEQQMRGNLPQAFVHAAMIETAARLR